MYPAQVFWSEADKGFVALALDLAGCSAIGDTQEEALRELQDAIHRKRWHHAYWLEVSTQKVLGMPVGGGAVNALYSGIQLSWLAGVPELRDITWVDLPTSHWPMWSRPQELAVIIGDVAKAHALDA
jgi:hypothetical protein